VGVREDVRGDLEEQVVGQPRQQRINYDQIKQCLAQMPMDKRAALRKRLNTARVTVVIKNQVIRM
jgi:hypothetical protein